MSRIYQPIADTVRGVIDHYANQQPKSVFACFPDTGAQITYQQLQADVRQQVAYLQQQGFKSGDTVSFMMCNGRTALTLFLSAMYGGYIISPLNPAAGQDQLAYVIDHSDTRLIFVSDEFLPQINAVNTQLSTPIAVAIVDVNVGCTQHCTSTADLTTINTTQDVMLMYTSGTTGQPKGVMLTQKNLLAGGMNTSVAHELSSQDRAMCVLPLCHINAQCVTVMAPLVSGGSLTMPNAYSTSQFWQQVISTECTWFSVVPTIISYLMHAAKNKDLTALKAQLTKVKFGRSASSALPPSLHAGFEETYGMPIVETMGMTETAAQILANPMPPKPNKYGSPGIAFGTQIKVVDAHTNELPYGEEGELMIKGDCVMRCYYKNPIATAKELTSDGWLHTGDLARMDADGFVFITGRIKELIIKGGENIAPREIDDVLYTHPAIKEAAAVGIPHSDYGQDVVACAVLGEGEQVDEEALKAFCLPKLGKIKSPSRIYFMNTLPKGPSGKVQRLKLVNMLITPA